MEWGGQKKLRGVKRKLFVILWITGSPHKFQPSCNIIELKLFTITYIRRELQEPVGKGRFPLQSFCPRGRSERVSTFAKGV